MESPALDGTDRATGKTARTGGRLSFPQVILGALFAAVAAAVLRRLVFHPLLGADQAKTAADFLMFFLLGYLALTAPPPGQSTPPLLSGLRLRTGLIFGVVAGLTMLVVNRVWP